MVKHVGEKDSAPGPDVILRDVILAPDVILRDVILALAPPRPARALQL